jgi:ribosomal protein L18
MAGNARAGRLACAAPVEVDMKTKEEIRARIHSRIRKLVAGTTQRPRLAVFRSQCHF